MIRPAILAGFFLPLLSLAAPAAAEDDLAGTVRSTVGITRKDTVIEALLPANGGKLDDPRGRILIVGSLDGSAEAKAAVLDTTRWFYSSAEAADLRKQFTLAAISCVNPDGLAGKSGPDNGSGGNPTRGYPPQKGYYDSPTDSEAAYLWRWIGMYGPDYVVEVRGRKARASAGDSDGLIAALAKTAPCDVGTVPGTTVQVTADEKTNVLAELLPKLAGSKLARSPCRQELFRRLKRQPADVAKELAAVYGHKLDQVAYIPSLAVIGRLRLAELTSDRDARADVVRIVEPYFRGGKSPIPKAGNEQAGHLAFAELAKRSQGADRERYVDLCRLAADQIFDESGKPRPLMPFNLEMSDAVFMAGPILCTTGNLTGERKYFDAAAQHLAGMRQLCLRDDGIYRHSPLAEVAWGRGNGFPALGIAWCLSELPEDHPLHGELLKEFRAHMTALKKHQDASGCWHQVIDKPASYREFTCTCMIGWAMLRGVRRGWFDPKEYDEPVRRAWEAVKLRVGPEGKLVDVCTGTGKMKSLREYYDRPAILGIDDRGGAMGLVFAVEMLQYQEK